MTTNDTLAFPVVKTTNRANYPFSVQVKNTENWGTHDATVTLAAALEVAQALAEKYPGLPVRIEHNAGGLQTVSTPPKWVRNTPGVGPHRTALWSGVGDPPKLGSTVVIRMNNLGTGKVMGYAVHEGYLGAMVQIDEATRPQWHKKQQPDNPVAILFGVEMQETLETLYALWDKLADVPVNDEDQLDEDLYPFKKGTPREEVWQWFERRHPKFVVGEVQQGIRVKD